MRVDENVAAHTDGSIVCGHCGHLLAAPREAYLARALVREIAPRDLGPQVRVDPARYSTRPISVRLTFCPSCLTQLGVDVRPTDLSGAAPRGRAVRMAGERTTSGSEE